MSTFCALSGKEWVDVRLPAHPCTCRYLLSPVLCVSQLRKVDLNEGNAVCYMYWDTKNATYSKCMPSTTDSCSFYVRSQNCEKPLLATSFPPGTTRLPADGLSWNLVFEYIFFFFLKICWENSSLFKICKNNGYFFFTWVRASWIEFNNCPTRSDLFSLLHFCRQLYMFQVLTPIIRSSYNCNYSFWYWSTGSTTIRSR